MYHQRRELGTDEKQWPHRILGASQVVRVESGEKDSLRLFVEPYQNGTSAEVEALEVDLIVAATGYKRDSHVTMLKGLWPLLPEKEPTKATNNTDDSIGTWEVNDTTASNIGTTKVLGVARDYHVEFAPGRIAPGSGVWLQGCCEGTHGVG